MPRPCELRDEFRAWEDVLLNDGKYEDEDSWDDGDGKGTSRGESNDACRLEYEVVREGGKGRLIGCGGSK